MPGILASATDHLRITEYEDWLVFVQRLQELVASGRVKRIPPMKSHMYTKEDEWYFDPETGEIYVHVIPDAPTLPKWEKADVLAPRQAPPPHPNNLSAVPVGNISDIEARSLKSVLDLLVRQGLVEIVPASGSFGSAQFSETRFKDLQTGAIYRLVESSTSDDNRWERVPPNELQASVQ